MMRTASCKMQQASRVTVAAPLTAGAKALVLQLPGYSDARVTGISCSCFLWCCVRLSSTVFISRTHQGAVTPAVTSRLRDFSDDGSDDASAGLHRYRAGGIRLLGPRLLQQDVRLNWTFSCMRMHTQREN